MSPISTVTDPLNGPGLELTTIGVVLLGVLVAVLWFLRRLRPAAGLFGRTSRRLNLVEVRALGPRHRLVLVRVDQREFLIGVSPSDIALLARLPREDKTAQAMPGPQEGLGSRAEEVS
jgi:flagellar protein FliO/FliZ